MKKLDLYEKVIVRNKVYRPGHLNSSLIELQCKRKCIKRFKKYKGNIISIKKSDVKKNYTLENLKKHYDDVTIMKVIFDEDIECVNLHEATLYKKYQEIVETGKDNDLFCTMYKLKDNLAVSLDAHIHLYHITNLIIDKERILPWDCLDNKVYIADTWWDTDEEILHDMENLSFVDFMNVHKAY